MEMPDIGNAAIKTQYQIGEKNQKKIAAVDSQKESTESQQLSPLAQLIYAHDVEQFNYSKDQTHFAYYSQDGSLAVRSHSQLNIQSRQETYSFDLTFSAESLGLTTKDFEGTGGKPIEFGFTMLQQRLQAQQVETAKMVKTLRKPGDILQDLAQALQTILRDKGNKSISYILDEEARQALMGDPEIVEALGELVMMMGMINLMKAHDKPATDYTITVSGKGKPYMEYERRTDVIQDTISVEFHLTILPPKSGIGDTQSTVEIPELNDSEVVNAASEVV